MKDPYLKPVIFGGIFITLLSIIFAPGIFLWAGIGGYIAVRLANKITKEIIPVRDGLLMGLFSGIVGGSCLDILTLLSFKSPDNQRLLIRTLEKNWPKEIAVPNFIEILPTVFITTCIFIIVISIIFGILGGYIGSVISKRTTKKTES